MGFFDFLKKKNCDICGEEIGLLGNRKLQDGNMCKNCAKKLSPFFSERKESTIEEIQEQLAYREQNEIELQNFTPTKVIRGMKKVFIDEQNGKFVINYYDDYKKDNPDIIDISQVTNCNVDVTQHKTELYDKDEKGNRKSYTPPRYDITYEFRATIYVNSPWFSKISFEIGDGTRPDSKYTDRYRDYEERGEQLKEALNPKKYNVVSEKETSKPVETQVAENKELQSQSITQEVVPESNDWTCTCCGTINTGKFCEACGSPRPKQTGNVSQKQRKIRCDKCGWIPDDENNLPRFCPECGDAFNENDVQ